MLIAGTAFKGYAIAASDGTIGTAKTFLFDDSTWKIRWLVVDTGHWLSGRKVLIHPSAIGAVDHELQQLPVALTKAQIEASPDIAQDRPVTAQMESGLYDYYGWDPYWGPNYYGPMVFGLGAFAPMPREGSLTGRIDAPEADAMQRNFDDGDVHLRDMSVVADYHIDAKDGSIGHVQNFLLDDATWAIRYLIVDTSNWWMGQQVLIAPYAVTEFDWGAKKIHLNVTRETVRSSPKWDPLAIIDHDYESHLHRHYGWPNTGW